MRSVPAAAEASCRPPRADPQSEASGAPRSSASDGCVPEPAWRSPALEPPSPP